MWISLQVDHGWGGGGVPSAHRKRSWRSPTQGPASLASPCPARPQQKVLRGLLGETIRYMPWPSSLAPSAPLPKYPLGLLTCPQDLCRLNECLGVWEPVALCQLPSPTSHVHNCSLSHRLLSTLAMITVSEAGFGGNVHVVAGGGYE